MISPELLRRYEFFAGLSQDQIVTLSKLAHELEVEEGHYFYHEGDTLASFFLAVDGAVGIVLEIPDQAVQQPVSGQLTGDLITKDITITKVGSGMIFGLPGIIPPNEASSTAKALTPCMVYVFDSKGLMEAFEEDCELAYLLTLRAAQNIRNRLKELQVESLSFWSS